MKKRVICLGLVLVMLGGLFSCTPQQKIVGTWVLETSAMGVTVETTYVFEEDGTGSVSSLLDLGMAFRYGFQGDKLVLTFDTLGIETTQEFEAAFAGDTLTLIGGGQKLELTKQN